MQSVSTDEGKWKAKADQEALPTHYTNTHNEDKRSKELLLLLLLMLHAYNKLLLA